MLRAALIAAVGFAAAAAHAAEPLALLFETPHMEGVERGETLSYSHDREAPEELALGPTGATRVALEKTGPEAAALTLDADGAARRYDFDGVPGNPLLMVLLENAVRATSRATGGSPFYLRNRVREALRDGLVEEDGAITARPFAEDDNRDRLGAFADLELRFVVDESAPGMLVALGARTPDGSYAEEFRLDEDG